MPSRTLLIVFLALVVFPVVLWWILPRITGWRAIALRYPAVDRHGSFSGVTSVCFGVIGGYNNCVLWAADDDYLHLKIMPPFSAFHPPVSIPWAEVVFPPDADPSKKYTRMHAGGWRLTMPTKCVAREIAVRRAIAETEQQQPVAS